MRGAGILTSCELVRARPAAIAFFVTGRERCADEIDALARAARTHPQIALAAVAVGGDRGATARLVARRGWRFPVAYDRDAVLANLYGVAVCPQITYVRRGGLVDDTTIGELDERGLDRQLAGLERRSAGGAP